jgi:flagellar basal body-associated protein FliL
MSNNKNKLDAKSKQLIIGIFAVLILLTFSAVMLIAAYNFGNAKEELTTTTTENTITPIPSTTLPQNISGNVSGNNNQVTSEVIKSETETHRQQEPISVEGLEEFTKTGDNQISDSENNEFIKLVVNEKGVDAERLVAIYAVPDLGNNFVLEFDNKRDENGNIIRSPKTLKKIYHINKEREITVATGKPTGNEGVDYGTSLMTYYLVTDVVMPEFPDYFTDVG